jgi:hypothetical protein
MRSTSERTNPKPADFYHRISDAEVPKETQDERQYPERQVAQKTR